MQNHPLLLPLVSQADAVITQFAPVSAGVIAAMQKARVIVRTGVGVDNVDLEAARLKGIPVCNQADIVTLHCPSTAQTRKLLNAKSLASMKPGAIVINLARGDLIDTAALVDALQSGHTGAAALECVLCRADSAR